MAAMGAMEQAAVCLLHAVMRKTQKSTRLNALGAKNVLQILTRNSK